MADEDEERRVELPACPHCGVKQLFAEGYPELDTGDVLKTLMLVAADYAMHETPPEHVEDCFKWLKQVLDEAHVSLSEDSGPGGIVMFLGIVPDDEGTAH